MDVVKRLKGQHAEMLSELEILSEGGGIGYIDIIRCIRHIKEKWDHHIKIEETIYDKLDEISRGNEKLKTIMDSLEEDVHRSVAAIDNLLGYYAYKHNNIDAVRLKIDINRIQSHMRTLFFLEEEHLYPFLTSPQNRTSTSGSIMTSTFVGMLDKLLNR
ncbi:MAG: hypothetical protein D6732_10840 [Methanobacteriota archaeon]|nr:MAG: hypothetical protein D6732_10840 [Euryarchaeota archaeon]